MMLLGLLGLAVLFGVGLLGYLLAQAQDDNTTTADGGTATATDADADDSQLGSQELAGGDGDGDATATDTADDSDQDAAAGTDAEGEADGDAADTVTVDVDDEAAADETAETGDEATDDATDSDTTDDGATDDGVSTRRAAFRGGKVYLSGAVPSEEIGQLIEERAAAVLGPDNVVNEYTIDPTVEIQPDESTPLIVEDVVLFEFNSVEIAEPFLPILDLGVLLLRQNPQASVTVITRTDAVGSAEVNLEVSRQRANAIVNYWLGRGVNADQIEVDAKGEEGASESDDEATAANSRRAEFVITGLLN